MKVSLRFFILTLFFFVLLILLIEGVYYYQIVRKAPKQEEAFLAEPTPILISKPGEIVAMDNIDVFLLPGEDRVGYFTLGQIFTLTGEEETDFIRVIDSDGYKLWIRKDSDYSLVGEVSR